MHAPRGYRLGKQLRGNERSAMCIATRASDGREVVLELFAIAQARHVRARAEREVEALRAAQGAGVVELLDVIDEDSLAIVLACPPGLSLADWRAASEPAPATFLEVACQLASALARVHEARWLHLNVHPASVYVDPTSCAVTLAAFGAAQRLGTQMERAAGGLTASDLRYVSPEQTGRMNRGVDARSDLYSLGATLYLLLTGVPPFDQEDPLALVHAHMARRPRPPAEHAPAIPSALARITMKLLEKDPEDRYRSARTLLADLESCRAHLAARGHLADIHLVAANEAAAGPARSAKLYGRERELRVLQDAYAVARRGETRCVVVEGDAGIGKSALVASLRRPVAETGGYFLAARFDGSSDRPHAAFAVALDSLAQQMLVESDARLASWRASLRGALGSIARVIVDLAPDMRFVLGELDPVPVLDAGQAQTRLVLALQRVLAVCATPDHPLVVFLDDAHWSDAGSCALLEDILLRQRGLALLLVCAYRRNALADRHPFPAALARMARFDAPVATATLAPLSRAETTQLLAAALHREPDDIGELVDAVERKTANVPLLVHHLLEHLHGQGILSLRGAAGWYCDPVHVSAASIPDCAAGLIADRIQRLPPVAHAALGLASVVGGSFDAERLSQLSGACAEELAAGLFALADAGLIAPCAGGFQFAHDRVRESAAMLLDAGEHARMSRVIARRLLEQLPDDEVERRVFEIADYQQRALRDLAPEERAGVFGLQVRAGRRALAAGAATTAEIYLDAARRLIRSEDFEQRFNVCIELYLSSAETALLRGDLDGALVHLAVLDQYPLSLVERSRVAARRITVLSLSKDTETVAAHTLAALRSFGVRWPLHPSHARLAASLFLLRVELGLRGVERVFRPATRPDPRRVAIMHVLADGAVVLSRVDRRIVKLICSWVTRQNLRLGYVTRPAYSLAALGSSLFLDCGQAKLGLRLHAIALAHSESEDDPVMRPRIAYETATWLRPWQIPRREALRTVDGLPEALREVGAAPFASFCEFLDRLFRALAGDPVAEAEARLRDQVESLRRAGYRYPAPDCCHHAYRLLLVPSFDDVPLAQHIAEGEVKMAQGKAATETFGRSVWLMVLCIYGRFDLAFAQSEAFYASLLRGPTHIHIADHVFFRGIAAAALATSARGGPRRSHARVVRACLRQLQQWWRQRGSPDLAHMAALLDAERERLARRWQRARQLYDSAIRGADQHRYPHHAALAAERRGLMLLERGQSTGAAISLAEATRRYREWGCEAKARSLERLHGQEPRLR